MLRCKAALMAVGGRPCYSRERRREKGEGTMAEGPVSDDELRSRTAVHRERLGFYRDASTFLRDVLIAGLILFCIARPDVVRSWLGALGVSKATFLGFELSPVSEKELAKEIDLIRQQRDAAVFEKNRFAEKAANALREVERLRGSNPSLSGEIAALDASAKAVPAAGPGARTQSRLIDNAQQTLGDAEGWAVVFGGDPTLAAARTEIDWARRNGLDDVGVVLRQRVFRSAVFVPTAEAAEGAKAVVSRRRPDAYVVNLASWCADLVEKDGYRECR